MDKVTQSLAEANVISFVGQIEELTLWWRYIKSQEITKNIKINPVESLNIVTKLHL